MVGLFQVCQTDYVFVQRFFFDFIAHLYMNQSNSNNKLDDAFVFAMVREFDVIFFDAHVTQNICIFACMYLQSNSHSSYTFWYHCSLKLQVQT